jgi:spore coat polysaccharide biosynthesis predicted glycosyltransferase SpsG
MKLQIICKGTTKDGLGHLIRTHSFARAAHPDHEVEIIAIVEKGFGSILEDLSCKVHLVKTDDEVIPFIEQSTPEIIIFDLMRLNKNVFLRAIDRPYLSVSLSPIFEHKERVNILVSRSKSIKKYPGVKNLAGLDYAIFNDNCLIIGDTPYKQIISSSEFPIAICMGGADAANKTLKVLKALGDSDISDTIWVILGEGYEHSYDTLVQCLHKNKKQEIIFAKTNRSIWKIMGNCSLAILAGGLTTIEAIYAGLPTINLYDKQENINVMATELFDLGVCLNGGIFSDQSLKVMCESIIELKSNRERLWQMHKRSNGLVDSRGSERVLSELKKELDFIKGRK